MKCAKCGYDNLIKANYCKNCGNRFTQEEKDKARDAALIGKIEKVEKAKGKFDDIKDFLTLSFITDNLYVRIGLILLPLIISLVFGGGKPSDITIMNSNDYDIYYNTDTNEYFLDLDGQTANLSVAVPSKTEYIIVTFISNGGYTDTYEYSTKEGITINARDDGKYTIEAVKDGGNSSLTFHTV